MTREIQLLDRLLENPSNYYWSIDDEYAVKVGNVETASMTFKEDYTDHFVIEPVFRRDDEFSSAAPLGYSVSLPEGQKIKELISKVKSYLKEQGVAETQEENEDRLAHNADAAIADLYNR